MYTIWCDNQLIYSPMMVHDGYGVIQPKVTVGLNKSGSCQFTLPVSNPRYDDLQKMKSVITVYDGDEEIFRGRVLNHNRDFYRNKVIYCEGQLAFLLDSQVRPYEFRGTPEELFTQLIENHNSRVDAEKRFEVGLCDIRDGDTTNTENQISRSKTTYAPTWDEINEKLISPLGGYLKVRLEEGHRYIDYLTAPGIISTQQIVFGKNLIDLTDYVNAADVYTVIVPTGAEGLTIKEVNDGKDYLESDLGISLFGRIEKHVQWENVTVAQNLLTKAGNALSGAIKLATTLTVNAVDMHLLGVDTAALRVGNYIRVISIPHGIDELFLCSEIDYDLAEPDKTKYTLGVTRSTLTETSSGAANAVVNVQGTVQNIQGAIDGVQGDIDTVNTVVQEITSNVSTLMRFCGAVTTETDLDSITNPGIGNVYRVTDVAQSYVYTADGWAVL